MSEFKPKRYHVYCSVPSKDKRNKTGEYTFRVGITNDRVDIPRIIMEDRISAANTFVVLTAKPEHKRTYSVFEAEWTKLEI
jgi:hypothetical protein